MTIHDSEPGGEDLVSLLAAYDDSLAAGTPTPPQATLAPAARARFLNLCATLDRLERHWPRAGQFRFVKNRDHTDLQIDPASGLGRIGRFRLLRELGRGGQGIVFQALDPATDQIVAVKLPRPESLLTTDRRERFLREIRVAANLDHPHLIAVREAHAVGPVAYIVTAYCPGPSLASWLREPEATLPPDALATLLADLAEAVHYLHQRGIVHRDIKPSNILLEPTSQGGSGLPFRARLTDFGLAREADGTLDTASDAVLGTPAYMAPEQADGRREQVGPATDVYALGVILYEMLAGHPPFRGRTALDVLRQILAEAPAPPRRGGADIPRPLATICLKCLEKSPSRRYASAADLAADLRRFAAGLLISARPPGWLDRAWRWCLRPERIANARAIGAAVSCLLGLWCVMGLVLVAAGVSVPENRFRFYAYLSTMIVGFYAPQLLLALYTSARRPWAIYAGAAWSLTYQVCMAGLLTLDHWGAINYEQMAGMRVDPQARLFVESLLFSLTTAQSLAYMAAVLAYRSLESACHGARAQPA